MQTSQLARVQHGGGVALVLGAGGARGAYEVGVVSYLRETLQSELGVTLPLDVLCGTSVGALNACALAATADTPATQGARLRALWSELRVDHFLRLDLGDAATIAKQLVAPGCEGPHGGLINVRGLRQVLSGIPWSGIGRNLRTHKLAALTLTATRIDSGEPTVFFQQAPGAKPMTMPTAAIEARIGPRHALASAAIPLLFAPVEIDHALYADGGLRMSVPLAPALHLGASHLIVVSINHPRSRPPPLTVERAYSSAPFLAGKALTALLVDHTEQDLERLRHVNQVLDAGTRVYGASFEQRINDAIVGAPVRRVHEICVRPSVNFGVLAADFVSSRRFRRRLGLASRFLRALAERESAGEADLVSYLLFETEFAEMLYSVGRSDAAALRDQWLAFFAFLTEPAATARG